MAVDYTEYLGYSDEAVDRSSLVDARGTYRTQSLFIEEIQDKVKKRYTPVYNMSDKTRLEEGLMSAYHIYMSSVDEYEAAMKLVGSMKHWRKLLDCSWFMEGNPAKGYEGLNQWREDMADRDSMVVKRAIMKSAKKGDTGAARLLLDMSRGASRPGPGRPSTKQEAKDKEAAVEAVSKEEQIEAAHKKMVNNV